MISIRNRTRITTRAVVSTDSLALELCSSFAALVWGAWVLLHPPSYFAPSAFYRTMVILFPQNAGDALLVCGAIALVLGLAGLAVAVAGATRPRRRVALISLVFWLFLTFSVFLSEPNAASAVLYPLPALLCGIAYVHLRLGSL